MYGRMVKGTIDEERCNNLWIKYVGGELESDKNLLFYITGGGFNDYLTYVRLVDEINGKRFTKNIMICGELGFPLTSFISKFKPVCEARNFATYMTIVELDRRMSLGEILRELASTFYKLKEAEITAGGRFIVLTFTRETDNQEDFDEMYSLLKEKQRELEQIGEEAEREIRESLSRIGDNSGEISHEDD